MDTNETVKTKRTLSPEHLAKLAAGRAKSRANKKANISAKADTPDTTHSEIAVDEARNSLRPRRTSLKEHRNTMTVEGVPAGYLGRWVNDDGNRLHTVQDRGYQFVFDTPKGRICVGDRKVDANRQTGTIVSKIVGTSASGKPLVAYLMAQKQEWYDEDQKYKQELVDQREKALHEQDRADGLVPIR